MNNLLEAIQNLREKQSDTDYIIGYGPVYDHFSDEVVSIYDSFEKAKEKAIENTCYVIKKYFLSSDVERDRWGELDPTDAQILKKEVIWTNPEYDAEREDFFYNEWNQLDEYIAFKGYWELCKMLKTEYPNIYKKALSKNMIIDNLDW